MPDPEHEMEGEGEGESDSEADNDEADHTKLQTKPDWGLEDRTLTAHSRR